MFTILVAAAGLWPVISARGQTVTFDFDSGTPVLSTGQNTPFDQTSGGITARFSSPPGTAFSIQTDSRTGWRITRFSGNYLYDNNQNRNALDIAFSQPITGIAPTFATADFQTVTTPAVFSRGAAQGSCIPVPIDLGPSGTQVALTLNRTGIAGSGSLAAATARIGGVDAQVRHAGAQPQYVGLDPVNVAMQDPRGPG